MSFLEDAETLLYRGLMGLPVPLQRVLSGRPLQRQGQTLATENQLMLRMMRLVREPGIETLPLERARRHYRRQTRIAGGRQPVGEVRHLEVAGRPARLYVPTGAPDVGPLLLWFHGGAYLFGDLESHDPACRFLAERSGARVLALDYRLAPEHPFPAAHDDCVAAHRWLVEHAAVVGTDPDRLAVGGDSAGGCLAATTAIQAARTGLPLALQVLVYPATDMRGGTESRELYAEGLVLTREFMDRGRAGYLPRPDDVDDPRASPMLAELPAGLAPAYVATAGFDPLRDEGEAYAARLEEAGVPTELRRFAGQLHGFLHLVGVGHAARTANAEVADRVRELLVSAPATR